MSSGKWRPFCLGQNVLAHCGRDKIAAIKNDNKSVIQNAHLQDHFSVIQGIHGEGCCKNSWAEPLVIASEHLTISVVIIIIRISSHHKETPNEKNVEME